MGNQPEFSSRGHPSTPLADPVPQRATIEVYEGHEIAFRGDAWVNATQMAKPFGKLPADFVRLAATKAFVAALIADSPVMGNPITVQQGGLTQGTWMHPDLGMEFARWLSPEFGIWCNRQIRRIWSGAPSAPDTAVVKLLSRLVDRVEALERSAPAAAPAPALAAAPALLLPPPPTLDGHVAEVLLVSTHPAREFGLVHPVEIARAAVVEKRFLELCTDPSDHLHVSKLLRFFQGGGFFNRWLRSERGWLVFCEPRGRNRHRRYAITSRREGGAS